MNKLKLFLVQKFNLSGFLPDLLELSDSLFVKAIYNLATPWYQLRIQKNQNLRIQKKVSGNFLPLCSTLFHFFHVMRPRLALYGQDNICLLCLGRFTLPSINTIHTHIQTSTTPPSTPHTFTRLDLI